MDCGSGPSSQSLLTTSGGQRSEERSVSESTPPVAGVAVREASLSAECSTLERPGPETAEDEGRGGKSAGSGSHSDTVQVHNSGSVASSANLVAACDDALEALKPGEMDPFLWLNKCQSTIKSLGKALRKFSRRLLASRCAGNTQLESIVRVGGPTRLGDAYDQRFQAIDEYIVFAEKFYAAPKRVRRRSTDELEGTDEIDENEEADVSSDEMTASSSEDLTERVEVNQSNAGTSGGAEVKGSEEDAKRERPEEDSEVKRRRAISSSTECMRKLLKTDGPVGADGGAGDVVNPDSTEQDLESEDMSSNGGRDDRESRTGGGGAEEASDQCSTSSKGDESDVVEQASDNIRSSAPDEARLLESDKAYACERARVIRKLVTRQGVAVSRMNKKSERRTFRMYRECQYLIKCLKCAMYICNSALSAQRTARVALEIAVSSGARDVEDCVRQAEYSAAHYTDMALVSCESAVRLHKEVARLLEEAIAPLLPAMDDVFLARLTVREVTRTAEDVRKLVDRGDITFAEVLYKLSLMESMIDLLSDAFTRAKNVNMVTEHMEKKFDDATFPDRAVSTVFEATCFVLKAMAAATNALVSL